MKQLCSAVKSTVAWQRYKAIVVDIAWT